MKESFYSAIRRYMDADGDAKKVSGGVVFDLFLFWSLARG
jgi:hypothetical protein